MYSIRYSQTCNLLPCSLNSDSSFLLINFITIICGGYFEMAKLTVGDFKGYCVGG